MGYIILSTLLAAAIYWIARMTKKQHAAQKELKEAHGQNVAAMQESHKEEMDSAAEKAKAEKESLELSFKDTLQKKDSEIDELRKTIRNRGEFLTQAILERIKEDFIKKELITSEEMIILPNVFIPEGFNRTRQLDHLVLLKTGLYIIETKHWKGQIVLGMNKQNTKGKFSFLNDLNPKEDPLVFDDNNGFLTVKTYGNPIKQVQKTYKVLEGYLKGKSVDIRRMRTVIFFNHDEGKLHDWFENRITERFDDKLEFLQFFRKELTTRNPVYTAAELKEIQDIILSANY